MTTKAASDPASGPIVLCDIDGTLIRVGGAGVRALALAFEQMFGVSDALRSIELSGRSDSWIVGRAFALHGMLDSTETRVALLDAYVSILPGVLEKTDGCVLPGVHQLLRTLRERGAVLGLGTGNFRRSGFIKLAHFGLHDYFGDGGFGEDSEERAKLLAIGVSRLRPRAPSAAVVVIGDTPHDVRAARAIEARAVAVATGFATREELEASRPDVTLPDLSNLEAAVKAIDACET